MTKKSRVEILQGKLRRMGESDALHPEMPEEVAEAFIAELRFDPCCAAMAAHNWRPDNRNEEPWIREMLDTQPRLRAEAKSAVPPLEAIHFPPDEPVN